VVGRTGAKARRELRPTAVRLWNRSGRVGQGSRRAVASLIFQEAALYWYDDLAAPPEPLKTCLIR
jgi:hypothetical protein